MKKKIAIIVAAALALVVASCSDKSPDGRTDTVNSGTVSFAADASFSPLIQEEIEIFESQHPNAKLKPIWTNESDGLNKLLKDSIWLMITARDFKKSEYDNLYKRQFRPSSVMIAYDALALIVNNANRDTLISVPDFKRILNGEVTQWSQLYKDANQGEITVVFDNKKSSTVHFVEDSVLGGKPIKSPNVSAVNTSAEVINYVEKNPGAIGIIGNNWLNDKRDTTNLTFNKNIRVMRVSKVSPATLQNSYGPYQAYIYTDDYPLVRTIYALLNDPHDGLPTGFAHFLQSPIGQRIVLKTGLLPAYGDITFRDVKVSE